MLTALIVASFASVIVVLLYYKVADRSAFATLAQAIATIFLVTLTWVYVVQLGQSNAPLVGVTNAQITRMLKEKDVDTYDSVQGVLVKFTIKNTGVRPAKNVRLQTKAKIGRVVLPYTEGETKPGVILFPGVETFNMVSIDKSTIEKMVQGQKLLVIVNLSYTDWEGRYKQDFLQIFEVVIIQKEPLNLAVNLVSD